MKRFLSSKSLYVGQLVVTGDDVGTAVRTIAEIDSGNHTVILQWMEGNRFLSKPAQSYMLKKPDLEQIEWHIANGGQLISANQVINFKEQA
tara:strand:+ start:173 stop:445 length:273 start_codon:yes stop_codon:yes gene_type:complete